MNGAGGEAAYNLTDPATGSVESVNWKAPALNTIFYRFDRDEVRFILVYGRAFSPMPPWGVEGGGPMNDQQIDTLLAYMESIQIEREDCGVGEDDPLTCPSGHLPTSVRNDIDVLADQAVADGLYATRGEALFNGDLASGAYSCARCHTQGWSWGDPGVAGQGAFGWNLTGGSTNAHFPDDADMVDFVRKGTTLGAKYGVSGQGSGRMPGFGAMLSDQQIREIVEYVRGL
jgi:mono/diheme cytochrome c family protein